MAEKSDHTLPEGTIPLEMFAAGSEPTLMAPGTATPQEQAKPSLVADASGPSPVTTEDALAATMVASSKQTQETDSPPNVSKETHLSQEDAVARTLAAMGAPVRLPAQTSQKSQQSHSWASYGEPWQLHDVTPDNYLIDSELTRGGMGRIIAARDRRLQRPVALKELIHSTPEARARFEREILVTAKLQHPSIVPIYEAGRWPSGEPFYAMKMVNGRSLDNVVLEAKTFHERLALLPNAIAVAEAIAFAHNRGIIHRDLKPANVLVGAFGETVVIDWGLAKDLFEEDNDRPLRDEDTWKPLPSREGELSGGLSGEMFGTTTDEQDFQPQVSNSGLTVAGSILGTPSYMAPEQVLGKRVDERTDVFALGAIVYFVLVGKPPYEGRTIIEVLANVQRARIVPLDLRQPEAPSDLVAIVHKALSRKPADRYASAGEFAADLKRFQMGQLVAAYNYSVSQRIGRFARKHRNVLSVIALALLSLSVLGVVSLKRIVKERDAAVSARKAAEDAKDKAKREEIRARDAANQAIVLRAQDALRRDPAEAVAVLRDLHVDSGGWGPARIVLADALSKGLPLQMFNVLDSSIVKITRSHDKKVLSSASMSGLVHVQWLDGSRAFHVQMPRTQHVSMYFLANDQELLLSQEFDTYTLNLQTEKLTPLTRDEALHARRAAKASERVLRFSNEPSQFLPLKDEKPVAIGTEVYATVLIASTRDRIVAFDRLGHAFVFEAPFKEPRKLGVITRDTHAFLSPNGQYLVVYSSKEHALLVYDLELELASSRAEPSKLDAKSIKEDQASLIGKIRLNSESFFAEFSNDSNKFAIGTGSGQIQLFRCDTRALNTLELPTTSVFSLDFSNNGQFLAVGGSGEIWLWNLETLERSRLVGHVLGISSVHFADEGQELFSGGQDRTVRVWSLQRSNMTVFSTKSSELFDFAVSNDGKLLAAMSSAGHTHVWDLMSNNTHGKLLKGPSSACLGVAIRICPKSQTIATLIDSGELFVWPSPDSAFYKLRPKNTAAAQFVFSHDGRYLYSRNEDGSVSKFDLSQKLEVAQWKPSNSPKKGEKPCRHNLLENLSISYDGQYVAGAFVDSSSCQAHVYVWETTNGVMVEAPVSDGHQDPVFEPKGHRLALVNSQKEGSIRLWNVTSKNSQILSTSLSPPRIKGLVFSNDGQSVAALGSGDLAVVRLRDGAVQVLRGHAQPILDAIFSRDGGRFASTSEDNTLRIWDLKSGESRSELLMPNLGDHKRVMFLPSGTGVLLNEGRFIKLYRDDLPQEPKALKAWIEAQPFRMIERAQGSAFSRVEMIYPKR